MWRGVKDEGVSPDDSGRGSAGISTGLGPGRGAGMAAASGEGLEELRMAGPRLSLTPSPEVTASGNKEAKDNHGQHGGDTSGNTRPMQVDERYPIDRLVNGGLLVGGLRGGVDRKIGLVADDGRVGAGGVTCD